MQASIWTACSYKLISAFFAVAYLTSLTLAAQSVPQQLLDLAGYTVIPSNDIESLGVTQHASIVAKAKRLAHERTRNLPNFFCDMTVRRSRLQIRSGKPVWKPVIKEILVRVRYVDGLEDYKTLRIGRRSARTSFSKTGKTGVRTMGEFGGLLGSVRYMKFRWLERANLGKRSVYVFNVWIEQAFGASIKREDRPGGKVAWKGIICIDDRSNDTLAIALEAVNIPPSYGIQSASQSVVFSEFSLFDGTFSLYDKAFLVPSASESMAKNINGPTFRQSARYLNYKKFDAESQVLFESIKSKVTYSRRSK